MLYLLIRRSWHRWQKSRWTAGRRLMVPKPSRLPSRIQVYYQVGSLVVKSVTDTRELTAARRLRHEILKQELNTCERMDRHFLAPEDFGGAQLVVIDKRSGKVVGFFEFDHSGLLSPLDLTRRRSLARGFGEPGMGFESGQAFLHKDYRRGIAAALLRKGVAEYAAKSIPLTSLLDGDLNRAQWKSF